MSARPGPPPELVARYDQRRAEMRDLVNKAVSRLRTHDQNCRHDLCGMLGLAIEILNELKEEPAGLVQAVEMFVMASQMLADAEAAKEKSES